MSKKIYNKLIRDKIPEIIKADRHTSKTRIMDNEEYRQELFKKVLEEGKELREVKGDAKEMIKEISDVYEVVDAIIESYKLDRGEINKIKEERRAKRGGFKKKIFLEHVD